MGRRSRMDLGTRSHRVDLFPPKSKAQPEGKVQAPAPQPVTTPQPPGIEPKGDDFGVKVKPSADEIPITGARKKSPVGATTAVKAVKATTADLKTVLDVAAKAHESALAIRGDLALGDIKAQLERIKMFDLGPRLEMPVLGAGISGLAAAFILEQLGHKPQIFEGSERLGGRLMTHHFPDGTYHELGGMRIPESHDYTRHFVDLLGLQLRKFVTAGDDTDAFFDVAGVKAPLKEASEALYAKFGIDPKEADAPTPGAILSRHVDELVGSLTEDEKKSLFSTTLSTERLKKLDATSIRDFLLENVGPEAVDLIERTTTVGGTLERSLTWLMRSTIRGNSKGLEEIVGGMDKLTHGLADRLKTPIQFGTRVVGIHTREDGSVDVKISRNGGPPETLHAQEVLNSLPLPVMRKIENNFSADKRRAIDETKYATAYKMVLNTVNRFWESKYQIHGGASHSEKIGAVYYPSDNASPQSLEEQARRSEGRGVLLTYVWGEVAQKLGDLSPQEQEKVVKDAIARYHPEINEPGMVQGSASIQWDKHEWAQGAFVLPMPGQHELYAKAVKSEGGVHFMGEHASLDTGWIQGALISALRAVEESVTGWMNKPGADEIWAKAGMKPPPKVQP